MKQRSKKGFSLIELIVVIAVIAAIAAVIVPQFGNMSGAAKNAADQRNVQLWNEVYSNAYAMTSGGNTTGMTITTPIPATIAASYAKNSLVPALGVVVTLADGTNMSFVAPNFTIVGEKTYNFTEGQGLK
jgi:prepilin-type N-terminal cleavage/methylation domain-containing protein